MTRPAREVQVCVDIAANDFETYLPLYRAKRIHNHRVETTVKPLFPRYIFTRFDRERDAWGIIRTARNVIQILSDCDRRPVAVSDAVIMALKNHIDNPVDESLSPEYAQGQKVRILTGPAAGLEALFQGTAKDRTRAMLQMIGGSRLKLEVPIDNIAAA